MAYKLHTLFQKQDPQSKEWKTFPVKGIDGAAPRFLLLLLGSVSPRSTEPSPPLDLQPIVSLRGLPPEFEQGGHEYLAPPLGDKPTSPVGSYGRGWMTAMEFLEGLDKSIPVGKEGIVSREVYEAWDKVEEPWCYGESVSGRKVILIDQKDDPLHYHPDWTHIKVAWNRPMKTELYRYYRIFEQTLKEHGDFRFVYGFNF